MNQRFGAACALILLTFLTSLGRAGVCTEVRSATSIGMRNDLVAVGFDTRYGALTTLKNLATNDEYLKGDAKDGNPFRAYVDTTQLPAVLTLADPYPIQPVEDAMGGKMVDPAACVLAHSSFSREGTSGVLRLTLKHSQTNLQFELRVVLPDEDCAVDLELSVVNDGTSPRQVMVALPYLTALSLGPDRETNLGVRLVAFGQSLAPAWKNSGDLYGRVWGAQWNAVYDVAAGEALGIIARDAELKSKVVRRFPGGGMSIFYTDRHKLTAGERISFPTAQLIVSSGNWKPIARRYGQWLRSTFKLRSRPTWLDDVDLYVGPWIPSPEAVQRARQTPNASGVFSSFRQLDRLYLVSNPDENASGTSGQYDLKEWAQWWQGVIRNKRYDAYHHTDGVYDVREDLGGVEAFREGVARVEKLGRYVGLYVASQTVRNDSPFFADFFPGTTPQDWLAMPRADTKLPAPDPKDGQQSFYMCTRYAPWQDHLAKTIAQLLRQTGARYVRIDEFAATSLVCHNPKHRHADPYESTADILEFLRKIRSAMDQVDPQTALFTESATDITAMYVDGTLNAWSTGPDIGPMRLVIPQFVGLSYHSGQVESALNGFICTAEYACNRAGFRNDHHENLWSPGLEKKPKSYPEAKEWTWPGQKLRWHELGHSFAEAVRRGDPTDVNPIGIGQDPDEWAATLWRSPKYWLMVCGNRAALRPHEPVRVKLPELPDSITSAYEFDTATLEMRQADLTRAPDGVYVTVSSGFAAVLLPTPECPAVIQVPNVPQIAQGTSAQVKLEAFAPWRRGAGGMEIDVAVPGLTVAPTRVRLPGIVSITAPEDSEPGSYALRINGAGCLRAKRWLTVLPTASPPR